MNLILEYREYVKYCESVNSTPIGYVKWCERKLNLNFNRKTLEWTKK